MLFEKQIVSTCSDDDGQYVMILNIISMHRERLRLQVVGNVCGGIMFHLIVLSRGGRYGGFRLAAFLPLISGVYRSCCRYETRQPAHVVGLAAEANNSE